MAVERVDDNRGAAVASPQNRVGCVGFDDVDRVPRAQFDEDLARWRADRLLRGRQEVERRAVTVGRESVEPLPVIDSEVDRRRRRQPDLVVFVPVTTVDPRHVRELREALEDVVTTTALQINRGRGRRLAGVAELDDLREGADQPRVDAVDVLNADGDPIRGQRDRVGDVTTVEVPSVDRIAEQTAGEGPTPQFLAAAGEDGGQRVRFVRVAGQDDVIRIDDDRVRPEGPGVGAQVDCGQGIGVRLSDDHVDRGAEVLVDPPRSRSASPSRSGPL